MNPQDVVFMQRALTLAAKGKGRVSPNPCVGCVIVKNGSVVAEGFHAAYGGPHAEIVALKKAGAQAKGADMYVTLEPCAHWGKTGPCAPEVVRAGVRRVHIAMSDPFPKVAGRGAAILRRAGIKVSVGLEREAAEHLNRCFLTWVIKGRPHILYKAAMTLDGKTASHTKHSRWITGGPARDIVHRLRTEADAILVGTGTALTDNPVLTSHGLGRNPLRVIIDRHLKLPLSLQVFNTGPAPTAVICGLDANRTRVRALEDRGVQVLRVPAAKEDLSLPAALKELAKRNVSQLLVEGGGETAWRFVRQGLLDEAIVFVAPMFVGGAAAPTPLGGRGFDRLTSSLRFSILSTARVGDDLMIHAMVKREKEGA